MNIFSKIKEFIENSYPIKLIKKHCLASKIIILLGLLSFFFTIFSIFFADHFTNPSLISIRSVMSSIFGYLFGDNVFNNNDLDSKNLYTIVASVIALSSLIAIMIGSMLPVDQGSASIVETRNLLFSSVGFLVSRAKSHDVSKELEKICDEQNIKKINSKNKKD